MSDYKVDFLPQADRNAAVAQELQQNQNWKKKGEKKLLENATVVQTQTIQCVTRTHAHI